MNISFLKFSVSAALLVLLVVGTLGVSRAAIIPEEAKIAGFGLGCQAYTFNRFSVFEAIEKTAQTGGKTIEFYPGQKLSADEPDVKWDHHASEDVIKKVQEQLAHHHIVAVNYGVVG